MFLGKYKCYDGIDGIVQQKNREASAGRWEHILSMYMSKWSDIKLVGVISVEI